jgi:Fe(II)/alpha-ketoglutarate-dependent arginine beta-hydroxylase
MSRQLAENSQEIHMEQYHLSHDDIRRIKMLLNEITSQYTSAEDQAFLDQACVIAHELPKSVRSFLLRFKTLELSGLCLISGIPIDEKKIGPTPKHWKNRPTLSPALEEEILLILFGSLLGDAFGWSTQQNGHIVHDVMPIQGHEGEQLGTGSQQLLWWHNEDAFHPYRGDYIGMLCLRNFDNVITTFACINNLRLDEKYIRILYEPRFAIRPDESHLEKNGFMPEADSSDVFKSAYDRINGMQANPDKIALLFGAPDSPYIRLDPYFMDPLEDKDASIALEMLIKSIDEALTDIVLRKGECCFIDNFRAVHGRKPFNPRYDGNDRWLKRINITRDLRKSRSSRVNVRSRILV